MSTLQLFDTVPDVGTTVSLTWSVKTLAFPPQFLDASGVQLRTTSPSGDEVSWPVFREDTGRYRAEVTVDVSGQWFYRWESAGPVRAKDGSFVVRKPIYGDFLPGTPEPEPLSDPPYTWDELAPYSWDDLEDLTWDELGGEESTMAGTYTYEQSTPVSTWIIVHNLNRYPSVTVVDEDGNQVWVSPDYDNANQITLTFSPPMAGTAYLN